MEDVIGRHSLHGVRQSVRRIVENHHQRRSVTALRYLDWQRRRATGRFPFEQTLSRSRIVATDAADGVSALIHVHGLYDYNNMSLIKALLAAGGRFYDVGANVGSYTLVASEQPSAEVVAFEPHPGTFERLRANVALNARENVSLVCAALSDTAGPVSFTDMPASALNHVSDDGPLLVETRRGSECFEAYGVPDVMKIDVEGFERSVLASFDARLPEVALIFVEHNGMSGLRGEQAPDDILRGAGFDGPFTVDFPGRRLGPHVAGSWEDPAWIGARWMELSARWRPA